MDHRDRRRPAHAESRLADLGTTRLVCRANGRESIEYRGGGRIDFLTARAVLGCAARGMSVDLVVLEPHVWANGNVRAEVLPIFTPNGDRPRLMTVAGEVKP